MTIIYMLTKRFNIELYRPYRACVEVLSYICRVAPYAVLCRPVGACIEVCDSIRRVSTYADLCRPVGACIEGDSPLRRFFPYANLFRPFPTSRDKSRLAFDKNLGQLVYHYHNFRGKSYIITCYLVSWSNNHSARCCLCSGYIQWAQSSGRSKVLGQSRVLKTE